MKSLQLTATDALTVDSTQQHPLGFEAVDTAGRHLRYGKAGGTVNAGELVVAAANVTNHLDGTPADAAVGATTVTVTVGATAVTENQYQGGVLLVNDGTGQGQTFIVKGNTAADASGSTKVYIEGALTEAIANSDSKITLYPNKFNGVTTSTTAALRRIGVSLVGLANGEYGWFVVRGVTGVLVQGTAVALADPVIPSTNTAGAVEGIGTVAATDQIVGFAVQAGTTTEHVGIDLNIE